MGVAAPVQFPPMGLSVQPPSRPRTPTGPLAFPKCAEVLGNNPEAFRAALGPLLGDREAVGVVLPALNFPRAVHTPPPGGFLSPATGTRCCHSAAFPSEERLTFVGDEELEIQMRVPRTAVKSIIGRKGATIKKVSHARGLWG